MESHKSYWQENLRLILICLVIWFVVSFGFGLLLVEPLNEIRVGGYKLGFWFAQQGSIYTFVGLIFWYSSKMNKRNPWVPLAPPISPRRGEGEPTRTSRKPRAIPNNYFLLTPFLFPGSWSLCLGRSRSIAGHQHDARHGRAALPRSTVSLAS